VAIPQEAGIIIATLLLLEKSKKQKLLAKNLSPDGQ